MQKMIWFIGGVFIGLTALSITRAAVSPMKVTDDTAIYQKMSEIRVRKEAKIDFDSDIGRLARLEDRYHEKLPPLAHHARLKKPIQRVARQKYKPTGSKKSSMAVNTKAPAFSR
jgi:hypothetical protein